MILQERTRHGHEKDIDIVVHSIMFQIGKNQYVLSDDNGYIKIHKNKDCEMLEIRPGCSNQIFVK